MNRESRYPLRLPEPLKERIQSEAEKTGLSINEFIIRSLSAQLGGQTELERRITDLERRLAAEKCPTP